MLKVTYALRISAKANYEESELVIQQLLEENGAKINEQLTTEQAVPITGQQSPETYIGYSRLQAFSSPETISQRSSSHLFHSESSFLWTNSPSQVPGISGAKQPQRLKRATK